MSKNSAFESFFAQNDFAKAFENYQSLPFDWSILLETQRKNIQALTDAQQKTYEALQTIMQRQGEVLSNLVEQNGKLAQDIMGEGTPEEKLAKNADAFQKVYEDSVQNLKGLSDMIQQSNDEASQIINSRVSASVSEIKSAIQTSQKQKKAA